MWGAGLDADTLSSFLEEHEEWVAVVSLRNGSAAALPITYLSTSAFLPPLPTAPVPQPASQGHAVPRPPVAARGVAAATAAAVLITASVVRGPRGPHGLDACRVVGRSRLRPAQ